MSFCNLWSIFIRVNPNRIIRIYFSVLYRSVCFGIFLHMVSDKCLTMNYPYASHRFPQIFNPVTLSYCKYTRNMSHVTQLNIFIYSINAYTHMFRPETAKVELNRLEIDFFSTYARSFCELWVYF